MTDIVPEAADLGRWRLDAALGLPEQLTGQSGGELAAGFRRRVKVLSGA